jgi:CRP-like cAMP-binding protein
LLEHRRHKHDVVAKTKCSVYLLDARSLSRLARSHPEILRHIRDVAEARAAADEAARSEKRKQKPRAVSAGPRGTEE